MSKNIDKTEKKEIYYDLFLDDVRLDFYILKIESTIQKYKYIISSHEIPFRRGFLLVHQKGTNTLFFKFPVDIVITDSKHRVIKILSSFMPNRFTNYYEDATNFYILPERSIEYMGIQVNKNLRQARAKKIKW